MQSFGSVFSSFNEMAAGTGALSQQIQSQMSVFNAPHKWYKEGSGDNNEGIDFHMEAYAGDNRFKDENGDICSGITTPEKQEKLYERHVLRDGSFGMDSSEPFYGVDLTSGKIYQYNPRTKRVEVSDYDGDTKGYGQRLPDGWQNFLRESRLQ